MSSSVSFALYIFDPITNVLCFRLSSLFAFGVSHLKLSSLLFVVSLSGK